MDFASRIKKLRKDNGYTQVSLGQALGVTSGTVAMWETGKRKPGYEILNQLSGIFDRRIDYILGFSDDAASPKAVVEDSEQLGMWETQSELIDVFRQYPRLDTYGKMNIRSLLNRETFRCQEQGTEESAAGIMVGIKYEDLKTERGRS